MSFLVGRYKLQGTPDKMLATLRQAQVDDKVAEKRTRSFGCTSAVVFLIGFGSLFFEAFAVAMGMGVVFASCLVAASYWSRRNVDDRKIEVPLRLLEIARADLSPTCILNLELDFRTYHNDRCRTGPENWAQTWMTLKGKLADGNRFKIQVEWIIRRREKAKHRGRKVKERLRDRVTLGLRVNPRSYPWPQQVSEALVMAPPPAPLLLSWVRPLPGRLEICLTTPPQLKFGLGLTSQAQDGVQITGDTLLGTLVWTYRGLKVAKARVIPSEGAAVPTGAARAKGPRGGAPHGTQATQAPPPPRPPF